MRRRWGWKRTNTLDPYRDARDHVERYSEHEVPAPHLRLRRTREDETLVQPPRALHQQHRPRNLHLPERHRRTAVSGDIYARRDSSEQRAVQVQRLAGPEGGQAGGDEIEACEPVMWEGPGRRFIEDVGEDVGSFALLFAFGCDVSFFFLFSGEPGPGAVGEEAGSEGWYEGNEEDLPFLSARRCGLVYVQRAAHRQRCAQVGEAEVVDGIHCLE